MNLVVRRRLAAGALLSSSALVAGLLIAAPGNAAAGGLSISPTVAVNTEKATVLTYKGTDADFEFGGTATFSRIGGGQPFTADINGDTPPRGKNTTGTGAPEDFTDEGDGVGIDGPADAGVYNVSATGTAAPIPTPVAPGGGTDTCPSCFTVLSPGAVTYSSITPSSIRPGNSANITVAGNNFERGTTIQFLFADGNVDPLITATAPPTDSSGKDVIKGITTRTQIQRRAKVDVNDAPGARGIRITNLDGNAATCSSCFSVAGPALTSITPTGGVNDPGTFVTVTFNGVSTSTGMPRLEFTGPPGGSTRDALSLDPVPGTTAQSGNSVSAQFDLSNAAPGPYQAVVRDSSSGITNACESPCAAFTVAQRPGREPPTVTGLDRDPNTAGNQKDQQVGTTLVFDVVGTNLSKGVAIKTTATKTTVTGVEFVSPTLVRATIVTAKDETPGDYNVTATLTDGSLSAACSKCYTVVAAQSTASPSTSPSSSPCPSSSASASGSPSATASATASGTASPTASATASSSSTATPSASSTATISPSGSPRASGCPSPTRQAATLITERSTINAGESVNLFATGQANQQYSLQCYTRPSTSYTEARSGAFNAAGDPVTFTLNLGRNTRCFLQYVTNPTQDASDSVVVNVKTVLSLSTVRQGTRKYLFQGRNLPRIAGQLITLYRVDNTGREIRTSNLVTDDSGIYRVTRTFTGTGTFRFKVRTSQTNNNAAGVSNTITVRVY